MQPQFSPEESKTGDRFPWIAKSPLKSLALAISLILLCGMTAGCGCRDGGPIRWSAVDRQLDRILGAGR